MLLIVCYVMSFRVGDMDFENYNGNWIIFCKDYSIEKRNLMVL